MTRHSVPRRLLRRVLRAPVRRGALPVRLRGPVAVSRASVVLLVLAVVVLVGGISFAVYLGGLFESRDVGLLVNVGTAAVGGFTAARLVHLAWMAR